MSNGAQAASPETWLDDHGDALFAFALLRVANRATAEDLVQDTLLAALGAADGFEARASVRTWLTGILKNKIVDHLRRSGRETSYLPDAEDAGDLGGKFDATGHWATAPANWGDPAAVAENSALRSAMLSCIEHLPEKLRTPFLLREVDGLETNEVVELLGLSSANNLWVTLSRGRERVRECLERSWFGGKKP
ncbi:MAG: sigma-70 family RNA polymerase sigma factor [Gammaproteobacteria bacterium]